MTDDSAVVVTDLSASADGSIHVGLEMQGDEEAPVDGAEESGPDVVDGVAKAVKTVLGAAWDVIKPSE